jgi:chemotaxis methyl-accepting protein methylase
MPGKTRAKSVANGRGTKDPSASPGLRVIGIGASAGGLEAIEHFLARFSTPSGCALLVVQHLDPTHKTVLGSLLQNATKMPVVEARSRVRIRADTVYVIPPNKNMAVRGGTLMLSAQSNAKGPRLPIDFLFNSLAAEYGDRAVGVVLSGMGADGTEGLRAIAASGGLCLAQLPATTKFPSMPQSAIDTGLVSLVAAPERLPALLLAQGLADDGRRAASSRQVAEEWPLLAEDIVERLNRHSGRNFSDYKRSTILRRIERRLAVHRLSSLADYLRLIDLNPGELELLAKELLIGVTGFFRDPAVWERLTSQVLPALVAQHSQGKTLRAWIPACSTGEEAYSMAMALHETLEDLKPDERPEVQIFATDLNPDAIDQARAGLYPAAIVSEVSAARLRRFFTVEEHSYRVSKAIRQSLIFATHDVTADPPFTRLDLISCRNLLIYLMPELQQKLMRSFQQCLNRDGLLVLGTAETVGPGVQSFVPLDSATRIYRRADSDAAAAVTQRSPSARDNRATTLMARARAATPQSHAELLLLERFAPPAIVVNGKGDILYFVGRIGRYLEPAVGKANLNIHSMLRKPYQRGVAATLRRVLRKPGLGVANGTPFAVGSTTMQIIGQRLDSPRELRGLIILVFSKLQVGRDTGRRARTRVHSAADVELRLAEEDNQVLRSEMLVSQQQVRSANEELQAANEELQTTNEELTTSKEEMQSMNEELQTVNAELQSRLDSLSLVNSDLQNLLNSADMAIVFLDGALRIRRFTNQATRVFKLVPGDVGRSIGDIKSDLVYPQLEQDVVEMLRTLIMIEHEVRTADDRWYGVRIMPYRTVDNVIDGAVMTFSDITTAKRLEARLRAAGGQHPVAQHPMAQHPMVKSRRGETEP